MYLHGIYSYWDFINRHFRSGKSSFLFNVSPTFYNQSLVAISAQMSKCRFLQFRSSLFLKEACFNVCISHIFRMWKNSLCHLKLSDLDCNVDLAVTYRKVMFWKLHHSRKFGALFLQCPQHLVFHAIELLLNCKFILLLFLKRSSWDFNW